MTLTAYIGLGANLGQPAVQVSAAIAALARTSGVTLLKQSALYRSTAIGQTNQPDYCNAVCSLQTSLDAENLFDLMIAIEQAAGRVRDGTRWGPRVLDLDLLHVENLQLHSARLTLPHPEIARRNFVLIPLAEVAPELEIPGVGRVSELVAGVSRRGLSVWPA
jgi:2-amino-4-hydroxy-6-hydroxymethyldihydropteridine diphosphokinase